MITVGICKLLLVEDDQDTIDLIVERLSESNIINYTRFSNAKAFLENFDGEGYNIVILDHYIGTNQYTGVELTKIIKAKNRNHFIIGFSGLSDPDVLEEYINCDIDKWINKNSKKYDYLDKLVEFIIEGIEKIKDVSAMIEKLKSIQLHSIERHDSRAI